MGIRQFDRQQNKMICCRGVAVGNFGSPLAAFFAPNCLALCAIGLFVRDKMAIDCGKGEVIGGRCNPLDNVVPNHPAPTIGSFSFKGF